MANWSNTYFEATGIKSKVERFVKRFEKGLEGELWHNNSIEGIDYSMDCVHIDKVDSYVGVSGSGRWSGPYELVMKWAKDIGKGLRVHYVDYEPGSDFYVEFEVENGIVTMERSTSYYTKDFFKWLSENDFDFMGDMEFIADDYTVLLRVPIIVWNMKELGLWDEFVEKYLNKNDSEFIEVMEVLSILEENKEELLKLCKHIRERDFRRRVVNVVGPIIDEKIDDEESCLGVDKIIEESVYFVHNLCDYEREKKDDE